MACCRNKRPAPAQVLQADQLKVEIYDTRADMGAAAADDVAKKMKEIIAAKGKVVMVFAAAPSQNEFLATLCAKKDLDWSKVIAFHMDEYIGLQSDAPQGFGNFLRRHIFDIVKPAVVNYLNGGAPDAAAECKRYGALLEANPVDITCMGIGENGHIAFNDPPVADFNDPVKVKIVELDQVCREQQVHDGCFAELSQVPTHALTMTVPALVSATNIYCMVPAPTKAKAVLGTVKGQVATSCPASILRTKNNAVLYLDKDSSSLL